MGTMDELINPRVVRALTGSLMAASTSVEPSALREAEGTILEKNLRQRVDLVRDAVLADIRGDFADLQHVITRALKQQSFTGWMIWPVTEAVSTRALASGSVHDFDAGMDLLAQLTSRLSSEFAVRELLNARPERALARMTEWAADDDEHVRRLATEGSRAHLPWARKVAWLIEHPQATRAILDATYRDSSEYVRRSAANHLNDLSRVDAAVVTEIATGWAAAPDANTTWVTRHGLRTLLKRADPIALSLVGFTGSELGVTKPELAEDTIAWGGSIRFIARVTNVAPTDAVVAIDYSIGFVRANGTTSPKTFKLAVRRIPAGETIEISKAHSFRPITTRSYYPGSHMVTVQANGVVSEPASFVLGSDVPREDERRTLKR